MNYQSMHEIRKWVVRVNTKYKNTMTGVVWSNNA